MSEDYVQVPRRLLEELAQCLGTGDGSAGAGAGGLRAVTPRRAIDELEPRPGRVPALDRETRRIDTGGEVMPEPHGGGGGGGSAGNDPTYCEPRPDTA